MGPPLGVPPRAGVHRINLPGRSDHGDKEVPKQRPVFAKRQDLWKGALGDQREGILYNLAQWDRRKMTSELLPGQLSLRLLLLGTHGMRGARPGQNLCLTGGQTWWVQWLFQQNPCGQASHSAGAAAVSGAAAAVADAAVPRGIGGGWFRCAGGGRRFPGWGRHHLYLRGPPRSPAQAWQVLGSVAVVTSHRLRPQTAAECSQISHFTGHAEASLRKIPQDASAFAPSSHGLGMSAF